MKLGEIDHSKKPLKSSFYLCKPDETVVRKLVNIRDEKVSVNLGEVNELSFSIPTQIESDRKLIDNPLIDEIKHRYLIKMVYNHQTEYFIFLENQKSFSEDSESISYKAYSRGYQLIDKDIRNYEAETKDIRFIAEEVLDTSKWKVGSVDSDIALLYRSFSVPSSTLLDAIYELAKKFGAIIEWDTVNLIINFRHPSKINGNKGLKFKEGKYLESFNANIHAGEMVTRLKVYGQEGLTFRRLSPTGANYIEDFGWFMYPFEQDELGNVIKSSDYMSDSLCIALKSYYKSVETLQGEFDTLTKNYTDKQDEIQKTEQQLSVLQTELIIIFEESDVLNTNGKAGTPEHDAVIVRKNAKEAEVNAKMEELSILDTQLKAIQSSIDALRSQISIESHLTPENILELDDFIIVKDYTNDSISSEEDLLEDGLKVFKHMRTPKVNITMDIINFLSDIESQHDWHKLKLGDVVKLESKRLRVGFELKILSIDYDFAGDGISLTIGNEEELKDDFEKMLDEIYKNSAAATVVNMDKYKWDMAVDANDGVSKILNGVWDATKRSIQGGYKQNIELTERGLIAKSLEDPNKILVLQNGVLALSKNGGDNWETAITPDGVYAQTLVGKLILSNRMVIEDENGIIKIEGSKQEIFDNDGTVKVTLGKYDTDKYGLKIVDGAVDIRTSSTENSGVVFDGNGLRGYKLNGTESFKVDNLGNAVFSGELKAATGTFSGNLSAAGGTFSGNLNAAGGTFSGNLSAAGGTFTGTLSAVDGTFTTLSSGTIYGATISGGVISGATLSSSGAYGTTSILGGRIEQTGAYGSSISLLEGNLRATATEGTVVLTPRIIQFSGGLGNNFYIDRQSTGTYIGGGGIRLEGGVDFSAATVTGLYARFG